MKINIFPASSDLGKKVATHLVKFKSADDQIILSARNIEKIKNTTHEVRYADYQSYDTMVKAFDKIDVLFLIPSTTDPMYRVDEIRDAFLAAKKANVKKVVFSSLLSSTSQFFISPFLFYAERIAKNLELDLIIIRNSLYIDPMLPYADELAKTGILGYPAGNGKVSYMLKDEMAKAIAMILLKNEHLKNDYYLANSQSISMEELANIMSEATNSIIKYKSMTDQEFIQHTIDYGDSEELARILRTMYHAISDGDFDVTSNDYYDIVGEKPTSVYDAFINNKN